MHISNDLSSLLSNPPTNPQHGVPSIVADVDPWCDGVINLRWRKSFEYRAELVPRCKIRLDVTVYFGEYVIVAPVLVAWHPATL